jgi:hypothetical protein
MAWFVVTPMVACFCSAAQAERTFSRLRHIQTDDRLNMTNETLQKGLFCSDALMYDMYFFLISLFNERGFHPEFGFRVL